MDNDSYNVIITIHKPWFMNPRLTLPTSDPLIFLHHPLAPDVVGSRDYFT